MVVLTMARRDIARKETFRYPLPLDMALRGADLAVVGLIAPFWADAVADGRFHRVHSIQ